MSGEYWKRMEQITKEDEHRRQAGETLNQDTGARPEGLQRPTELGSQVDFAAQLTIVVRPATAEPSTR